MFALIIARSLRDLLAQRNCGASEGRSVIAEAKKMPSVKRRGCFDLVCSWALSFKPTGLQDSVIVGLPFVSRSDVFLKGADKRGHHPAKRPLVNVVH